MPRVLAFTIEPSDAFVGVLRLKAVAEASRWPPELSLAIRSGIEAEFRRLEDTVRTVGLCYADLEESGVAEVNRTPQSRFDDIDGALHLCACGVNVALDLDHLRVAFERGDRVAHESATGLASSVRSVLWYLAHTELFVCTRMTLSAREIAPERALEFTETYLAPAWRDRPPSTPPAPAPEDPSSSGHTGRHDARNLASSIRPTADPTGSYTREEIHGRPAEDFSGEAPTKPPAAAAGVPEITVPALSAFSALSEDARYFLFQADIRERDWPVHRATLLAARRTVLRRLHPDTAGAQSAEMHASAERGATEVLALVSLQEVPSGESGVRLDGSATMQIRPTDLLSDDARYFLDQSGLSWPGDVLRLDAARAALTEVAAGDPTRTARLERAFQELKRMATR